MGKSIIIVGAGGHAKVVVDCALAAGFTVRMVADDDPSRRGGLLMGAEIKVGATELVSLAQDFADCEVFVAIGDNTIRQRLQTAYVEAGWRLATVVHPAATVSPSCRIEPGTVVMPGAVVNADSLLGQGVIVNTRASLDHENWIGDFAHVAPGATLCGNVSVQSLAFVGAGATVIQGLTVGEGAMIGAGAAVTSNVAPGNIVVGVPAVPVMQ